MQLYSRQQPTELRRRAAAAEHSSMQHSARFCWAPGQQHTCMWPGAPAVLQPPLAMSKPFVCRHQVSIAAHGTPGQHSQGWHQLTAPCSRKPVALCRHRQWRLPSSSTQQTTSQASTIDQGATAMPDAPEQQSTWFDQLTETQRYVLADEWGFSLVGTSLPGALPPQILQAALPDEVFEFDMKQALLGLLRPLALMTVSYTWMWYMHSIIPWWQLLPCWLAIGTGYMGLFQIAHECARGTYLPSAPKTQEFLGALLMAPALFSLPAWRVQAFTHIHSVNQLDADMAWQPVTLQQLSQAGPWRTKWLQLISSTPIKLLMSIGNWVQSMQSWDLFSYYFELRESVLRGWMAPAVFAGVVLPCIMVCSGGIQGLINYWLAPWLVFHMWLSTLSLLRHTAPHIAWHQEQSHDLARAVVSGTVTVTLPGWLERLLNYPNYHLPQHVMFTAVPFYHAKAATQALRQRLWPYMQEAPLSLKLLWNLLTRWQVYDEQAQTYISYEAAVARQQAAAPSARDNSLHGERGDDGSSSSPAAAPA